MADKLDAAFAKTTLLLFGRQLSPLSKYSGWVGLRLPGGAQVTSAIGSGTAYLPDYGFFRHIPSKLVVSLENLQQAAGKKAREISENAAIADIAAQMPQFAFFVPSFAEGMNISVENTAVYIDCLNVRNCFDSFTAKNSSHSFSIMDCEGIFGSYRTVKSSFSIHCYNCTDVHRCFEMDFAKNCSDSMFCHNVENLHDCIFCFNTKNKRYAVCNVEVGREKYIQIKQMAQKGLASRLEREGGLEFDIYCLRGGIGGKAIKISSG